jgi:UDP-4-amino-4,6-dideoxy-N-acetyl-beta-L-altrosamine N-acetyltransferase
MLESEKLKVRAIEEEDLPKMVDWRNSLDAQETFYEYEPLSVAKQREWFKEYLQGKHGKLWIIEVDGKAIGTIGFHEIDSRNSNAKFGRFYIDPDQRNNGYGLEALKLVLDYGFKHLNVNRIYLDTIASNKEAISLYEKLGFKVEGNLRKHIYKDGVYHDLMIMGLNRFGDL